MKPCMRAAALALALLAAGCSGRKLVLSAERKAQIGGEFLRFYSDGMGEYGYGVVKENLKAQGAYRYSNDTLYFLAQEFREHFPAGFLVVKEGVLYMENGLHFTVKKNELKPR